MCVEVPISLWEKDLPAPKPILKIKPIPISGHLSPTDAVSHLIE